MPPIRSLPPVLRQFAAAALATLIGLPAGAAPVALPATPEAWRLAAQTDIDAAVQLTRENHPGAHDPHHPDFLPNLEAARRHGLALASRVRDAAGYVAAVEGFNVRIGDGHAGMRVLIEESVLPAGRWPGFVTVWRGDALYVYASQPGQPPVGSKLLGCDGKDAHRLILDNVFSFKGRVAEAGQWWSVARLLFVDAGNPFVDLPQRCRFESNGQVMERTLAWRELDDAGLAWLKESRDGDGDAGPVGMSEPRKNLYWVSMPTFHPNEEERAAYRAINREIEARRAHYLAADAVVVDLRRNSGGSSAGAWNSPGHCGARSASPRHARHTPRRPRSGGGRRRAIPSMFPLWCNCWTSRATRPAPPGRGPRPRTCAMRWRRVRPSI
ncbi:hypothetical protein [Massilia sp. GCM10023247]|uniref:hypothetical protein n=1 Tax=Massilia sp. GCM10023247 TaxID=3252643 RepID=UPI0036187E1A